MFKSGDRVEVIYDSSKMQIEQGTVLREITRSGATLYEVILDKNDEIRYYFETEIEYIG